MAYVANLKTFLRVYELGSMSEAGRDIRASSAVVSSRIAELEKHLGVRLFNRTTRSLRATEQGDLFYHGATKILETIAEVEGTIADVTLSPRGTLFVAAPLGLGKKLIAPLVPGFKDKYPDVNVRLRLSDRKVDITNEGLDAAFVLGDLQDSEMRVRKIHEFERVLCASPHYLKSFGVPRSGHDLADHNCLLLRFPGSTEFCWNLMVEDQVQRFNLTSPLESDDGDVLTNWALDGCGIVNKTKYEVDEHLKSGALEVVAISSPPTPLSFACVFPHKRLQDTKTRLFIDHMIVGCRQQLVF